MRENGGQNNSEYWYFLRSVSLLHFSHITLIFSYPNLFQLGVLYHPVLWLLFEDMILIIMRNTHEWTGVKLE